MSHLIAGSLFAFVEFMEMPSWYISHEDHFTMYFILVVQGIVDLLHKRGVLKENFWAVIDPLGFFLITIIFLVHPDDDIAVTMHFISAVIQTFGCVSWIIQIIFATQSEKYNEDYYRYNTDVDKTPINDVNIEAELNTHQRFNENDYVLGVNPIYTNPKVNETIFPALTGFCFMLNGIWWCDMGYRMYGKNAEKVHTHEGGMKHDYMHDLTLVSLRYVMYLTLFLVAFNIVLKKIDRNKHKQ